MQPRHVHMNIDVSAGDVTSLFAFDAQFCKFTENEVCPFAVNLLH